MTCLSFCVPVCALRSPRREMNEGPIFSEKNHLRLAGACNYFLQEIHRAEMPFLLIFLISPLEEYTVTRRLTKKHCCCFVTAAFPDGTDVGQLLRWAEVLIQCSNRKVLALQRLLIFHKASSSTHSAIAKKSFSVRTLRIRCTVQCSTDCTVRRAL